MAALTLIPAQVRGDSGWGGVGTAGPGGGVLGSLSALSQDQVAELWAPIEQVVPFASLTVENHAAAEAVKAAVSSAIRTIRAPRKRPAAAAPAKAAAPYGSNSSEVAVFIKTVGELTAIQWLRLLDPPALVASVHRH